MDKSEDVEIKYWCNGNKRSEVHLKNGIAEGLRTDWYESGAKKMECRYKTWEDRVGKTYTNLHGKKTEWYESGAKKSECKYSTGRITGIANTWYESGKMEFEIPFKVGVRHGVEIKWSESGKIESEDYYEKGSPKGKFPLNYMSKK
jgi:antitoxin component YwqK of YwqJK toxin-antitoxin module